MSVEDDDVDIIAKSIAANQWLGGPGDAFRLCVELNSYRETEGTNVACFDKVLTERDTLRAELADVKRERDELHAAWARVGAVLADEGCSCDEDPRDGDDLCIAHRIEGAWRQKP